MSEKYRFFVETGSAGSSVDLMLQGGALPSISIPVKGSSGGTDAKIHITLKDKAGTRSGKYRLDNAKDNFENNQLDKFDVDIQENLVDIKEILVESDCSGNKPGWLLNRILVQRLKTKQTWLFSYGSWLCNSPIPGTGDYMDNQVWLKGTLVPGVKV